MSLKQQLVDNAIGQEIDQLYELIKNVLIECSKKKKLCTNIIIVYNEAQKTKIQADASKYKVDKKYDYNYNGNWKDINLSDTNIICSDTSSEVLYFVIDKFREEKISVSPDDLCELEKNDNCKSESTIKNFFKNLFETKYHKIGNYLTINIY